MNLFRLMKTVALLAVAAVGLAACGQKGPLILPPKNTAPQVVTPIILPGEEEPKEQVVEPVPADSKDAVAPAQKSDATQPQHETVQPQADNQAQPEVQTPQEAQTLTENQPQAEAQAQDATSQPSGSDKVIIEEKPAQIAPVQKVEPYRALERESDETPLGILPHTTVHPGEHPQTAATTTTRRRTTAAQKRTATTQRKTTKRTKR